MSELERAATDHWMELLAGDYGSSTIEQLVDASERYHLVKYGRSIVSALRPCFFAADRLSAIHDAAAATATAIRTATERALTDREFRNRLGFPAYMDQMAEIDGPRGRASILARFDGMFDATGAIRFIELNNIPDLIVESFEANQVLARAPIARAFERTFPFSIDDNRDRAVDAIVDAIRPLGRTMPVGVNFTPLAPPADTPAITHTLAHEPWLGYLAARGCRLTFFELAALDVREDAVYAGGQRVDIVDLRVDALIRDPDALQPLLDAVRRGTVRTLFGLSSSIFSGSKLLFEALSDPAHADMFDHATQRALAAHVPWTRHVKNRRTTFEGREIDLLPFLASNRERFVIKPAGSYGGEGVVLGRACDQSAWEKALATATRRPHVAQEDVGAIEDTFPMLENGGITQLRSTADYNPFLWNGTSATGGTARVSVGIHNVRRGGSMAAVFTLHPKS